MQQRWLPWCLTCTFALLGAEVQGALATTQPRGQGQTLDPAAIAASLQEKGRLELDLHGAVRLRDAWRLPPGILVIHSDGAIDADGFRLSAPGLRLTLEGAAVSLRHRARLDVAATHGAGGAVSLLAAGKGAVDVDREAVIDASGAPGRGGRILISAGAVGSRGSLFARGAGRIEVEARTRLRFTGTADTAGGLIRLDPSNITIGDFSGSNTNIAVAAGDVTTTATGDGLLDRGQLETLLATNDVIVHTNAALSSTGLSPADLPASIVPDSTGGDIAVLASVTWNSAHSLALLAHDDLFVLSSVQNDGSGDVVGLAGWDGVTMAGLSGAALATSAYGNGDGDAFVAGSTTDGATGVAFGSQSGVTALRGRDITVQGSGGTSGTNLAFAMVGYRVVSGAVSATGAIRVTARRDLALLGGINAGNLQWAQIGHGGCVDRTPALGLDQGALSGAIDASAVGAIRLIGGGGESYAQIGHGGQIRSAATRGDVGGDITIDGGALLLDTGVSVGYAQIGHGGRTELINPTQGNLGGAITVTVRSGDLTLIDRSVGYAQIGHGGVINTSDDGAIVPATPASIGSQSGDVTVHVLAGTLVVDAGSTAGTTHGYSQIGHGGNVFLRGAAGPASGTIAIDVSGDVHLVGGDCSDDFCYAMLGHGGAVIAGGSAGQSAVRGAITGAIGLTSGGSIRLDGGTGGELGWAQIGHGGTVFSEGGTAQAGGASGDLNVHADGTLALQGGVNSNTPAMGGGANYALIGHGGPVINVDVAAIQGTLAGNITVSTGTRLDLIAAQDSPNAPTGLADAHIGHDSTDVVGGTLADISGAIEVTVQGETSLVNDPTGSVWAIGHRTGGSATVSAAPVTLRTGTLDFTAGPGATSATINDASFWPALLNTNTAGGIVTFEVDGSGSDGALINQEPLSVTPIHAIRVLSSRSITLDVGGSVTNNGTSGAPAIDLVDDDANPASPAFSPTAQLTINPSTTIGGAGPVRLFAVQPSQFQLGGYTPPATAFGVWYGPPPTGAAVVGINFKLAPPTADLAITTTDGVTVATPGLSVTYTIVASNAGPDNAPGAIVTDSFPSSLTCTWTCTAAGGGTCPASGAGNLADTVNLPAGSSVTYSAPCTVAASASGTLSNTALVTPPGGVTDPAPGNNAATDSDSLVARADLAITATDGVATATPGGTVNYTIVASNTGPSNATGATVADSFPAALTCGWTCIGSGGGTCPASGSGNLSTTVNLPNSGSVTFTASCTLSASTTGTLSNTATVTPPGGVNDPALGNNTATDIDTVGAAPAAVPTLDGAGFLALAVLLAASGAFASRQRRGAVGRDSEAER